MLHDPAVVGSLAPDDGLAEWLAAQPELTIGAAFDDARPRRGTLLGLAVRGADGRVVAAATEGAAALAERILATGLPLAGHDVKPFLVWELARRDPHALEPQPERRHPAARGVRHPIAAYILNAALRAQSLGDITAERLDLELPRAGELRGPEAATVSALAAAAVREPLGRALVDEPGLHRMSTSWSCRWCPCSRTWRPRASPSTLVP
ncbi:MAG: hypothetical protein R3C32_10790 [Chloroflexota bacterium]